MYFWKIAVFYALVLVTVAQAHTMYCISKQDWFLNGKKTKLPHSYEYLDENFRVTNEIPGKVGIYETTLPNWCKSSLDNNFYLRVDGAYQICSVYVNGKFVESCSESGFLPTYYDINDYLFDCETNQLRIVTSTDKTGMIIPLAGDYYRFRGIYRDVWIIETNKHEVFDPYSPSEYEPPALTFDVSEGWFRDMNGNKVFLKGVNYHQYLGRDWNYDEQKELRDLKLIKAMGANAIRTAHYPRDSRFYKNCDDLGLYVFSELPINLTLNTNSMDHLERYATKMVQELQKYRCVIAYGLFNEVRQSYMMELRYLNDLIHELDDSRPTYGAILYHQHGCSEIPDIYGLNYYGGWYADVAPNVSRYAKKYLDDYWQHTFFITEYGAGANINQTSDTIPFDIQTNMFKVIEIVGNKTNYHYKAKGSPNYSDWQPTDYQLWWHEQVWQQISQDPYCVSNCAGVFIWQMFDSIASRKEGGTTNLNTKGLMTIDREAKPAYNFYKKVWNQ